MNIDSFDKIIALRPQYRECVTSEPCLYEIIFKYYKTYYAPAVAIQYTERYFQELKSKANIIEGGIK